MSDDLARPGADLLAPGLVHELRQPLTGAEAAAALLERAGAGVTDLPDWRLLRAQLRRLREIVDGFAALVLPGASAPADFSVGPVVARAVQLLAHRIRPLGRRFALEAPECGVRARGTPAALLHATTNLVVNALDALEEVPPARGARLEVRVLAAGGGAEVRVSDEGAGIPAAVRARLFEPHVTTKALGGGIGLHLSRLLVERDGGRLWVVEPGDPRRLGWATTELCVALRAARGEGT
jgi:signal transduction histidine kinase